MLLTQPPDDIVLGGPIQSRSRKIKESQVQMIPRFPPGVGLQPPVEKCGMPIEIRINEERDHRFSPQPPADAGAAFP